MKRRTLERAKTVKCQWEGCASPPASGHVCIYCDFHCNRFHEKPPDTQPRPQADRPGELVTVHQLERQVIESAEQWRDEQIFTLKTPLTAAIDAYRAAKGKT